MDGQKALQQAFEDMLYAMDIYATLYALAPRGSYEAAYNFDDSVVTDYNTQFSQDMQALGRVLSKVEFRMRNYKETEQVAKKKIAEVLAESQAELNLQNPFPNE